MADVYKRRDGIFVRGGIEAAGGLREGEGEPSSCSGPFTSGGRRLAVLVVSAGRWGGTLYGLVGG